MCDLHQLFGDSLKSHHDRVTIIHCCLSWLNLMFSMKLSLLFFYDSLVSFWVVSPLTTQNFRWALFLVHQKRNPHKSALLVCGASASYLATSLHLTANHISSTQLRVSHCVKDGFELRAGMWLKPFVWLAQHSRGAWHYSSRRARPSLLLISAQVLFNDRMWAEDVRKHYSNAKLCGLHYSTWGCPKQMLL